MKPENWQQIKAIFNEAVELSNDEYEAFLNNQSDAEIVGEVRKLLVAERENNFAEPVANLSHLWQDERAEDFIGRQIGNYKITKEIGRGGMGIVFEASREGADFSQIAALKLLKRGMDSDAMLRRFRHERQILASLEHPNIARLLDGGMTDDGLQFFALEYVKGQPIDEYCSEKNLSINDRLRLFLQICNAVSFAHSRLVVHRDLKPSNILVTADGTVKLLDFGIAKILTPEEDHKMQTVTSLGMMTPAYASPEQIKGEIVATSSDIYSLGLILYELLTGAQAYNFPNNRPDEMARIICEIEPVRPSSAISPKSKVRSSKSENATFQNENYWTNENALKTNPKSKTRNPKSLRGDLDNIILKSLRKEPTRRYASVEQFAGDIKKHLEGLPVIARPDTISYRFEKFVLRNRVSVVAATLILLSLIGGIAATSWQAYRAKVQQNLAEKRFSEVRQMANNVVFKYYDESMKLTGSTKLREMMVTDALLYLDGLAQDSAGDASLQKEIGLAYVRIGKVNGSAYFANTGDSQKSVESYQKGIALLEPFIEKSDDVKFQWDFLNSLSELAGVLRRQGDIAEADRLLKRVVELNGKFLAVNPDDPVLLSRSAYNYYFVGDTLPVGNGAGENVESYRKSMAAAEKVLSRDSNQLRASNVLAADYQRIGALLIQFARQAEETGDEQTARKLTDEAIPYYNKALEIGEKLVKNQPDDALYEGILSAAKYNRTDYLIREKQFDKALQIALEGLQNYEDKLKADPENSENKLNLNYVYGGLAVIYTGLRDFTKADEIYRKMMKTFDDIISRDVENLDYYQKRQQAAYSYADELLKAGKIEEARKIYTEEFSLFETASNEKIPLFTASVRGFMLEKTADCDLANARKSNSSPAKKRDYYNSALTKYENALQLWQNGGAQISPGVSDAKRIEIVRQKMQTCRLELSKS